MDREESLILFKQGENAWNTWAKILLTERKALESDGKWIRGDQNQWNDETRSWHERAEADFSHRDFEDAVDFSNFHFPGDALFDFANFQGHANFGSTEFHGTANFSWVNFSKSCEFTESTFTEKAEFYETKFKNFADLTGAKFLNIANFRFTKFSDNSYFWSAEFEGSASFNRATFSDRADFMEAKFNSTADFVEATFFRDAYFGGAKFEVDAEFQQCSFNSAAYFGASSFKKLATFSGISGKSVFSLNNVKFSNVPDFTEAHFEEAPQFDSVDLEPVRFQKLQARELDTNIPSRWRALRRLANQAHDYEHELQFLKCEIIARRRTKDKLTHARFWFGWIYQLLSDFGRSMWLPLFWLGFSLLLFATIYACQSTADWYQPLIEPVSCKDGSGTRQTIALGVSVINAFPFAAINSSDLLNQFYACLYGIQENVPVIPYVVTFVSIIQFFVSAVLLFLFLLAVRNNFRIK